MVMHRTPTSIGPYGKWSFVLACAILGSCCIFASSVRADESETFQAYQDNWQKAQKAYSEKEYLRAVTFYDKVCELLPFEPTSRYQLACCHARLGNKYKALGSLETAVSFGWDDPKRIEESDDLKSLRGDDRFSKLVKESIACRDETEIIYAGKSVTPAHPTPVVVLLQGLGCGPRTEVPYWKPAADRLGMILVAPRGVTKVGSMMYGWQRPGAKDSSSQDYFDIIAASKRIEESIGLVEKKFTVDKKHVLLAGFSQGGGVALRMLGDQPESYCGAVAVCSLYQPPGVAYWKEVAKKRSVRAFVVAGKLDRLLPRSQQTVEQLRATDLKLRYEEIERMGHEYPTDYPDRLRLALEFVLDRQGQKP